MSILTPIKELRWEFKLQIIVLVVMVVNYMGFVSDISEAIHNFIEWMMIIKDPLEHLKGDSDPSGFADFLNL